MDMHFSSFAGPLKSAAVEIELKYIVSLDWTAWRSFSGHSVGPPGSAAPLRVFLLSFVRVDMRRRRTGADGYSGIV
jgi:hypothetical protein